MNTHLDDATLNDFVDGTLADAALEPAASHVASCLECRHRVDSLRTLRTTLSHLPRDVTPPHELLADVHAALERDVTRGPVRQRLRTPLIAAAVITIIAASSLTTALLLRRDPAVAVEDSTRNGTVRLVSAHPLERSWQDAIAELQHELDANGSALAPETRQVVESSLQVIDRALAEARAALLADPSNAALADMLRSGYQRKLDVLRSAAEHVRPAS